MNILLLIIALLFAFLAYANLLAVKTLKLHIKYKGYDLPTTEEVKKLANEAAHNLFHN